MDYITTRATINKGMKRILLLTILTVFLGSLGYGQTDFLASANGNWNRGTTWGGICEVGCVSGVDFPGPNDDVYTNGFTITINIEAQCNNLFLQYDHPSGVRLTTRSLRVHGTIVSWDTDSDMEEFPTEDLILGTNRAGVGIVLTGSGNMFDTSLIYLMDEVVSFENVFFDLGGQTRNLSDWLYIGAGVLNVISGELNVTSNGRIIGDDESGIIVNTGAKLTSRSPLNGGTALTRIGNVQVFGELNLASINTYLNCSEFELGENAILTTFFRGVNQTQGWWNQSVFPFSVVIHPNSTVIFASDDSQRILARTYGNLLIGGSPPEVLEKTIVGAGSLIVGGNLLIPSNSILFNTSGTGPISINGNIDIGGIWTPSQLITLTGSNNQNISGSGTFSFGNGLTINKSGGTVTLQRDIDVTNGLTMLGGQLNFGTGTLRLLSGDLTMQGTSNFVTGDGVLQIHSTTNSLGTVNPNFPNLTILSGATLNHARPMNISGHLTLNGTLNLPNTNQAILTFNGTGFPQNVSGSTVLDVRDLIALNDVNINSTVNVNGKLELGEGVDFDADGSGGGLFTLKADIGGLAGYVAEIPVGSRVLGNVSYERLFSNSVRRWRNIAMPVQGVTVADLQQSFLISGSFTGSDNGNEGIPENATGSLAYYGESAIGTVDDGWEYFPTTTNAAGLTNRRGYSAFMRDVSGNDNINIRVRGVINYGDQNMDVTYTNHGSLPDDGWNLIANPFPAPIEWGAGITKNANIGNVAYVWNASAGTYSTLNYGSGGKIASGQAFWVKANGSLGANSLVITESAKVNERNTPFRRVSENPDDRLVINLVGGTNSDPTVIQFSRLATDDFDGEYDGFKLRNEIFNLASVGFNGYKYAINHLAKNECSKSVPLSITNIQTGTYRLDFEGVFSFGSSKITLVDNYLGEETILNEGASYAFAVTSDPSSFGDARFVLEFDLSGLLPNVRIEGAQLVSESETGNQWFRNGELIPGATGQTYSPTESGLYYVEVTKNGCTGTSEAREFAVTSLGEGEFLTQGTLSVYPNPVTEAFSLGMVDEMVLPEGAPMILMNMNGQKVKEFYYTASYNRYDISNLPRGVYILNVESGNHSRKIRVIKH
jgi:hypothetical protein